MIIIIIVSGRTPSGCAGYILTSTDRRGVQRVTRERRIPFFSFVRFVASAITSRRVDQRTI